MSYAEIKKAINSDLSMPLNKKFYSSSYSNNRQWFRDFSQRDSLTTVLSVDGSGCLYNCIGGTGTTANAIEDLQIIIDGEKYLQVSINSKQYCLSGIVTNFVSYSSPSSCIGILRNITGYDRRQAVGCIVYENNTNYIEAESNGSSNAGFIFWGKVLPRPLRFEKSLVIKRSLTKAHTSNFLEVEYSLDD